MPSIVRSLSSTNAIAKSGTEALTMSNPRSNDEVELNDLPGSTAPMIIVMGETGAGKSKFINTIAPGSVTEGHGVVSCTQVSQFVEVKVGNVDAYMVDTPGFNDTIRSNADILLDIAKTLTVQDRARLELKGIIYIHNLLTKMTGPARRQLDLLKLICGEQNFKNVFFVSSCWDTGDKQNHPLREKELKTLFWKPFLDGGAECHRFKGTEPSARVIVNRLLNQDNVKFQLQHEILDQKLPLQRTTAGSYAIQERQNLQARHQSQILSGEERDESLEQALAISEQDVNKLQQDVVDKVDVAIKDKIKAEVERLGRKPLLISIVGWIIGIGGIVVNIINLPMVLGS